MMIHNLCQLCNMCAVPQGWYCIALVLMELRRDPPEERQQDQTRKKRIALYTGWFDPPGLHHHKLISEVVKSVEIDRLVIVPFAMSLNKEVHNPALVPPIHRATLLDLAFHRAAPPEVKMKVELFDLETNGFTPLSELVEMYSNDGNEVYIVIGSNVLKRNSVTGLPEIITKVEPEMMCSPPAPPVPSPAPGTVAPPPEMCAPSPSPPPPVVSTSRPMGFISRPRHGSLSAIPMVTGLTMPASLSSSLPPANDLPPAQAQESTLTPVAAEPFAVPPPPPAALAPETLAVVGSRLSTSISFQSTGSLAALQAATTPEESASTSPVPLPTISSGSTAPSLSDGAASLDVRLLDMCPPTPLCFAGAPAHIEPDQLPPRHVLVREPMIGSSKEIRRRIFHRLPYRDLVLPEVADYIDRYGLYLGIIPPITTRLNDTPRVLIVPTSETPPRTVHPSVPARYGGCGALGSAGHVGFLLNNQTVPTPQNSIPAFPVVQTRSASTGQWTSHLAVNDAWVERTTGQTAWIQVKINGNVQLNRLIADGCLISTAAGSTAYAAAMGASPVPVAAPIMLVVGSNVVSPRNWQPCYLPLDTEIEFVCCDPDKRPIRAFVDGVPSDGDVTNMRVRVSRIGAAQLAFAPGCDLAMKLAAVQFPAEDRHRTRQEAHPLAMKLAAVQFPASRTRPATKDRQ
ncbi:putative inorganic polyphosphate/ATP-NAD kinase [Paratrimastix pyriformis]|uniref:Inorganic polyphosphate/ATP-NAD kinase n=1 Tax=Paratrimastix pyriformis TaxID=342808 RepID=A0ABQ8UPW6_9EUKA|nr:putative inorganic polyphosphate/ATP-NAD kinase [Paratrimastix pyriformis]